MAAFGCKQQSVQDQLVGKWKIDKVEHVMKGEFVQNEFFQGTTYEFRQNNTATFDQVNDFGKKKIEGNWQIQDSTITIEYDQEIKYFTIEKINYHELVWVLRRGGDIRFRFERAD